MATAMMTATTNAMAQKRKYAYGAMAGESVGATYVHIFTDLSMFECKYMWPFDRRVSVTNV